jgi:rhamnulokinase
MDIEVEKHISEAELYKRTGIQKMLCNTIYQLMAIKAKAPHILSESAHLLMIPDYFHYRLTGVLKTEYTDATTTGLVNAFSRTWDDEIIRRCGFPRGIFGEIVPAGTILGRLTNEVRQIVGFDCAVALPPAHDTASAFLAVPARSDNSVYISSGTWSLMGVELTEPITTKASREENFANEGGYAYRYRYLKNIMGLWILQSVQKEIGEGIGFAELVTLARASGCDAVFDVNEERFFAPDSMVAAVREACRESGQAEPQTPGDFARCICRSLAISYEKTMSSLRSLTGKDFDYVNIIGGGSENMYLNELTASSCGVPVLAGPAEGTALGNIVSQMIAFGELSGVEAAREVIGRSSSIREVLP